MSRSNQRRIDPVKKKQAQHRSVKRIGNMLMFSMLIAASISSAFWLNQQWSTKHWDIVANPAIKTAIEAQLAAMPNKDFISMRPDHLRQQWLQDIPDIKAIVISRTLPDHLYIQAKARVATALWQNGQGQLYLFDSQGIPYRPLQQGESPDLPLLRVKQAQLKQVQHILIAIAQQGAQKLNSLSEIRATNQHWQIYFSSGVSWMIPQHNEVNVIHTIHTFMQQPRWRNRQWRVDARLPSRWFIRPAGQGGVI